MDIKELNEQLEKFMEDAEATESAWDTLENANVDSILEVQDILQFYTTKLLWNLKLEPTKNKEEGVVIAIEPNTRMLRYAMYQNGKQIDSLGTLSNPLYFKVKAELIDLSNKQAQQAIKAGVTYVMSPYGGLGGNCVEVLSEYGIDANTTYVLNKNVMIASTPRLRWMPVHQYLACVIEGRGSSTIPITQFNDYARPQTDDDRNTAAFIADQD